MSHVWGDECGWVPCGELEDDLLLLLSCCCCCCVTFETALLMCGQALWRREGRRLRVDVLDRRRDKLQTSLYAQALRPPSAPRVARRVAAAGGVA